MNTRFISIKRRIRVVDDEGKEKLVPVWLKVRINNGIPPSHRMCEGNRRG